jgi:hypothetical protein
MGQPIDANEAPAFSACREDHSPLAVVNLHGQGAGRMTLWSSSCIHLEAEVSVMAGVASATDNHPDAT